MAMSKAKARPKFRKPNAIDPATGKPKVPGRPFPKGDKAAWEAAGGKRPRGRPPLPKGTQDAFNVMCPHAQEALLDIVFNPNHPRHEQALEYVVNRVAGTPRSAVTVTNTNPITGIEVALISPNGDKTIVPDLSRVTYKVPEPKEDLSEDHEDKPDEGGMSVEVLEASQHLEAWVKQHKMPNIPPGFSDVSQDE
jgi:hypothetical protein